MSDVLSIRIAALSSDRSDKSARAFVLGGNGRLLPTRKAAPSFLRSYVRWAAFVIGSVSTSAAMGCLIGSVL